MDGGEGAVRYEGVYVRKRRSSSAARPCSKRHVLLELFCCLADSGFGSVLGWVIQVGIMRQRAFM